MPTVLVTGLTVKQNSPFSFPAVAVTTARFHFAYPRRDDQAEWLGEIPRIPENGRPSVLIQLDIR